MTRMPGRLRSEWVADFNQKRRPTSPECATSALDDPAFRSAIDELPDDERQVAGLLLKGLPIDAKDKQTVTIARVLGCTERTVRNRRDRAIVKLGTALKEFES